MIRKRIVYVFFIRDGYFVVVILVQGGRWVKHVYKPVSPLMVRCSK